jgi:DNA polymerase IV
VARRLRADGRRARTVVLKVKLAERIGPGRYRLLSRSRTLPSPTDDGRRLAETALDLWAGIAAGKRIRLVGVAAESLERAAGEQLDLLDARPARTSSLNRALDAITARFGDGAVRRGGAGRVERAAPSLSIKDRRERE